MTPGPHDSISVTIETGHTTICCACGRDFTRDTPHAARDAHAGHFGVELARAELEGASDD